MTFALKVGGSLHANPDLPALLKHWLDFSPPPVIVAGGGPFADAVRAAQKRWQFDEKTAHAMAVLAMRQYASLLAALSRLPLCRLDLLKPPCLWLPDDHVLPQDCPRDWRVSSDTMALAVAQKTNASHLALLKSTMPQHPPHSGELLDDMFWAAVDDWRLSELICAIVSPQVCRQVKSVDGLKNYRITAA